MVKKLCRICKEIKEVRKYQLEDWYSAMCRSKTKYWWLCEKCKDDLNKRILEKEGKRAVFKYRYIPRVKKEISKEEKLRNKTEIKRLYDKWETLRVKSIPIKDNLIVLKREMDALRIEIHETRYFDKEKLWCVSCNRSHGINTLIGEEHEAKIMYDECLFDEDHIWIRSGKKGYYDKGDSNYIRVFYEVICKTCRNVAYSQPFLDGILPKEKVPNDAEYLSKSEKIVIV